MVQLVCTLGEILVVLEWKDEVMNLQFSFFRKLKLVVVGKRSLSLFLSLN